MTQGTQSIEQKENTKSRAIYASGLGMNILSKESAGDNALIFMQRTVRDTAKFNWIKIKNEYVNTDISQRKLAAKYNISFSTLKQRANKEKWNAEKIKQHDKISKEVQQKTIEIITASEADRLTKLLSLTDKLSQKIEKAIEQLETAYTSGEVVETGIVDTYKMRQIVQSIKDLKDIIITGGDENIEDLDEYESDVFGGD